MQQYAEQVITEQPLIAEQPLSSLRQIIVSEKYILPYYYEHMNKTIKNPNQPETNETNTKEQNHFMDSLLEFAERGEITNDFKEQFINENNHDNAYTILDMNPNKSFSYKFKSFVQQLWSLNDE
jgi:hypothetical protein